MRPPPSNAPWVESGRKGRQKLAACLGTTDRGAVDYPALSFHNGSATVSQAQSFTRNWSRFQVGPTSTGSIQVTYAVAVVDLRTHSAIIIIGGSADLRSIEEAVKGVRRVVVPPKKTTPPLDASTAEPEPEP